MGNLVAASVVVGALVSSAAAVAQDVDMVAESARIVSRYRAVFLAPPEKIPGDTSVDAPLLGNGDVGVAVGGPPELQQFWLAKNDFWRLKSRYLKSQPRVFGRIDVSIPALAGATYRVEQELYAPVTVATFKADGATVTMRTWVGATENVLVSELSVEGKSVEVSLKLVVAEGRGAEVAEGVDGDSMWGVREFVDDVDIPTGMACALRVLGTDAGDFMLRPGAPVTIVAAMDSLFKSEDYVANVKAKAASLDGAALAALWDAHAGWWRGFWAESFVEIGDPLIEQRYYLSQYVMGSCSRDPEFPPSIFGTWITTDKPAWQGDYHLNYNHMAPYYGLYSSNHLAQADPYHAPLLDFMDRGQWYAREILDCRGLFYPVGIGPKGIETTRHYSREKPREGEGIFWGQRSNAAYGVVNMSMRWYSTYDLAYAREVCPYVRSVVDFWEDYLQFEDGRYVIRGDSVHEGSGADFNPIVSLALVRNAIETALDMSDALACDGERHEHWRHILEHLSGYATQEMHGKTVFRYTEEGTPWWKDNTVGIQHIYPAGVIGLESDPELLEVARNTITVMDRWVDSNGTNSFFPAAVRVGYDPDIILKELGRFVKHHTNPNGFTRNNPHGIENCSTVPNTINEMLCMGHQGVLRVFPVWPKDRDARFHHLRAYGAFIVSSSLKDGVVEEVEILSERGRTCTMQNPWPNMSVTIQRNGKKGGRLSGKRFTFDTTPGERIVLKR